MTNSSVSLVFPMYNEKEYLPRAIKEAGVVLNNINPDYEIIIVDDASTDGSGKIAEEIVKTDGKIKVIRHDKNRKLGGALKTGFSYATKDIIIYTDMDLPFDLALLRNIVPLISKFDVVIGCRTGHRESFLRVIYSLVYNRMINFILRVKVKDVNFALKIFKREVLNEIELKSEGSFINAEFLAKAKRLGCSINEVEVEYKSRTYGISRLSNPAVILKILYEMCKLFPEIICLSKKKIMYSKLKKLYKAANLKTKIYNFVRFKTCPFDIIKTFVPEEGTVVDLGCGTGIFLNLLRQDSYRRLLLGFDKDERKLKMATTSLNGAKNIEFKRMDLADKDFDLPHARCILAIDVLYYLDFNKKKELLERCYRALNAGSRLLIKDLDKAFSFKFAWTFLQEFLAVKLFRFTSAKGIYFGNRNDYISILRESGFSVETFDLDRGYFYPHILYVCKK
jgi:glycosyltransferase involved in cell wall biosynthesis